MITELKNNLLAFPGKQFFLKGSERDRKGELLLCSNSQGGEISTPRRQGGHIRKTLTLTFLDVWSCAPITKLITFSYCLLHTKARVSD
mgnify:CR=1 FL=1